MYYIIGYNNNIISRHRSFDALIKKSKSLKKKIYKAGNYPAFEFDCDKKEERQKLEKYFSVN